MTLAPQIYVPQRPTRTLAERLHARANKMELPALGTAIPPGTTCMPRLDDAPASKRARSALASSMTDSSDDQNFRSYNTTYVSAGLPQWANSARADPASFAGPNMPDCPSSWLDNAADWPDFALLRGAASGSRPSKFRQALGSMASSARVAFLAALIEGTDCVQFSPDSSTAKAARYYNILLAVVAGASDPLRSLWHWSDEQVTLLHRFCTVLVGGA
jgi:hypothetical protein